MSAKRIRHILSLSGGKDSTALAVYLRPRIPDLEYVFCDTRMELPETYEYLDRLEAYLGRPIRRLWDERGFDHWLDVYGRYLPSSRTRWCTRHLKTRPFERYVRDDRVLMYIGIRADEIREGYRSHRPNIKVVYPFKADGVTKQDVLGILARAGLDLPRYYEWRSRSGCYLCFFQQKVEWVGLLEKHPEEFRKAKEYEKLAVSSGCPYTWTQGESLEELARPERIEQIKQEHDQRMVAEERLRRDKTLLEVFHESIEACQYDETCDLCQS